MRLRLPLIASALVVSAVTAAFAANSLKATMKTWKSDAATAAGMTTGKVTFNEAELSRILQTFATDAKEISGRIKGSTAQAVDIKSRFAKFEADSTAALAVAGKAGEAKGRVATVLANCRSCHDVYAN